MSDCDNATWPSKRALGLIPVDSQQEPPKRTHGVPSKGGPLSHCDSVTFESPEVLGLTEGAAR